MPPADTGFSLYMYRQFMSSCLCTKAPVCAGTGTAVYAAGAAVIPIKVSVPVQTFVPVPDASASSYDINTGTGNFRKFGTKSILAWATSECFVRHQCWYRKLRYVWFGINTGPYSSVRHQNRYRRYRYMYLYRYQTLRQVRYTSINGTEHFDKLDTTSIPVPDTSVSSIRHPYRYREYRYRTEHAVENHNRARGRFLALGGPASARSRRFATGAVWSSIAF